MQLEPWLFHLLGRLAAWGSAVIWFVNLEIAREASQSTAKLPTTAARPLSRDRSQISNPAQNSTVVDQILDHDPAILSVQ